MISMNLDIGKPDPVFNCKGCEMVGLCRRSSLFGRGHNPRVFKGCSKCPFASGFNVLIILCCGNGLPAGHGMF